MYIRGGPLKKIYMCLYTICLYTRAMCVYDASVDIHIEMTYVHHLSSAIADIY